MIRVITCLVVSVVLCSCLPKSKTAAEKPKSIKNVILLIGDGLGPQQTSLLYYFSKYSKHARAPFAFDRVGKGGVIGISATEPFGKIVADSASSATQLATGEYTRSEMLGLDKDGDPVETILEKAQKSGLMTGLISDTRMTHATPAAFASHVANRWSEDEIAEAMIETAPDILFSGGLERLLPINVTASPAPHILAKSKRRDSKNLLEIAKQKGYALIHTKQDLENSEATKILGMFAGHNMPNSIWQHSEEENPARAIPNLAEMTQVALAKLSKHETGFFLMVEGGQIDWAAHQHDAGTMLHELITFNDTMNLLIDWVNARSDTLLIVTADHETGSFGFAYNAYDLPRSEPLSGEKFKNTVFRPQFNYAPFVQLDKMYLQKQSLDDLYHEYLALPKEAQNPVKLKSMIQMATGYNLPIEEVEALLEDEENKFYADWHRSLNVKRFPKMGALRSFYYDAQVSRLDLIGRALGTQQSITWGAGGHTATPVFVFAFGPKSATQAYGGYLTHPKLGRLMQESLGLEKPSPQAE